MHFDNEWVLDLGQDLSFPVAVGAFLFAYHFHREKPRVVFLSDKDHFRGGAGAEHLDQGEGIFRKGFCYHWNLGNGLFFALLLMLFRV